MKNHWQFNWYKYVLAILLPVILWCTVFSQLKKPALNEQVHVLYVGQQLDTAALEQELLQVLPTLTRQPVKAVSVSAQLPTLVSYNDFFTARVFSFDIVIIQQDQLRDYTGQNYFVRLTPALQQALPQTGYYRETAQDGQSYPYGLLLDATAKNRFTAHYSGIQPCYLFISPESVNTDTLNGLGKAGDNSALKLIQYLTENTP